MKRKLILIAVTFLGLLLAFGAYCLVVGNFNQQPVRKTKVPMVTHPASTGPGPSANYGVGLSIITRDADNALQGIYHAKDWKRSPDGRVSLTEPFFTLFQKDGQQVHITADKGDIYADEVGKNFRVRRAALVGNVKVLLDQGKGAEPRPPMESRPDDLVQILMEDIDFNHDLLQLTTERNVQVNSAKADIAGKGLSLRWNERPQELRDMELREGYWMKIKAVPEQYGVISLPGGRKPTDKSGEPALPPSDVPWPPARPTATTLSDAFGRLSTAQSLIPAGPQTPIGLIASPATAPEVPTSSPTTRGVRKNIYEATFSSATQDIKVEQAGRRLTGAGTLAFRFEWGNESQSKVSGNSAASAAKPTPAGGGAKAGTPKAGPADKPAPEPMMMTWTGPLKLVPVDYTDKPAKDRYIIAAAGDKVVLSDQQATATCQRFEFQSPEQVGHLYGQGDQPAKLVIAGGDEVLCEHMAFDRAGEVANLVGPGTMIRRSHDSQLAAGFAFEGRPAKTTAPAASAPSTTTAPAVTPDTISWKESVVLHFGDTRGSRSAPGASGGQYIKDAIFSGGVKLTEGKTGNFITSNRLESYFAQTADPKPKTIPTKVYAHGNVVARQNESDIKGEDLLITFKDNSAAIAAGKTNLRLFEADILEAGGSPAVITDRRDPQKPVVVTCDRLVSEIAIRKAILYGGKERPAVVTQGPNIITGPEIRLDQAGESAYVVGKGDLKFLTDRDLEGRQLPQSRQVCVAWAKGMEYLGTDDKVIFDGSVSLLSDTDYMECQKMALMFEKRQPTVGKPVAPVPVVQPASLVKPMPATAPADKEQRLAVGMESYSSRNLARIIADEKVLLRTSHEENDQLVQRTQVRSEHLIYDAAKKTIDMHGRGTMVHEDYRKPAPAGNDPAAQDGSMAFGLSKIEPPAQTVFKWSKDMQWLQESRTVTMLGDVRLEHRSGKDIVSADPKFKADLKKGQTTSLFCQEMLAKFSEPEQKKLPAPVDPISGKPVQITQVNSTGPAATQPTTTGPAPKKAIIDLAGPSMGPIEEFRAVTDVNITEGPMNILGQRVLYDRNKGLMEIRGYLKDQQPAKASLHFEDASDPLAKPKHWENAIIKCMLKEGRITKVETADGSSGGGFK